MTQDVSLTRIEALGEIIQRNLAIVQQALGIEPTDDDLGELEIESDAVAKITISNSLTRQLTAAELAEEKCHAFATGETNRARFLESQAMFVESVARFNKSKDRFVQRQEVRHRFYRCLTFSNF